MSLGSVLSISNPADYVKALSALLQEYEYDNADFAKQKMVKL